MPQKGFANRQTDTADRKNIACRQVAVGMFTGLERVKGSQARSVQALKTGGKQAVGHGVFRLLCQQLFTAALGGLELLGFELLVCLLPKIGGHVDASLVQNWNDTLKQIVRGGNRRSGVLGNYCYCCSVGRVRRRSSY